MHLARRLFSLTALTALVLAGGLAPAGAEDPTVVTVFKSPTCGCCSKWESHLEANGFTVDSRAVHDVNPIKASNGVPYKLASCHTAIVDGYIVEGHVPASDVKRLLEERPKVAGLAVPGMPEGSPGMEGPHPEAYRVYSFGGPEGVEVFSQHGP